MPGHSLEFYLNEILGTNLGRLVHQNVGIASYIYRAYNSLKKNNLPEVSLFGS